jgi:2-C-methyl-D-erythritol 2,4-cyclodiphosphate synthase
MRIGAGFDVHRFGPGRFVRLGGVTIPHDRGVVAHSDGDVLLHALMDALLGAAALGDIGRHFPPGDSRFAGADSRALLREVARLVAAAGFRAGNCDLTLIAEAPRIAPHREAMVANIAADLGIPASSVNVKATTPEGLGALGRGEGLAAQAAVLLVPVHGG